MRGLVDRARIQRSVPDGPRNIQGEIPQKIEKGREFWCRLTPPGTSESRGRGEAARISTNAQLLCGYRRDLEGVYAGDQVYVESDEFGDGLWDVIGDPTPIRRRKAMLGYTMELRRSRNE